MQIIETRQQVGTLFGQSILDFRFAATPDRRGPETVPTPIRDNMTPDPDLVKDGI